jgi:5-methylcytosine-specific restriction endonuclease McrA
MTSTRKVLVLSQSYEPLTITNWKKAFLLVYSEKAEAVDNYDAYLTSINKKYPLPSIIRLKGRPRFNPFKKVELNRKNVFKRDNGMCQYCGSTTDLTLDHVIPKSKGGKSTWDNLVTACMKCNNKKDNKTPADVGLRLLSEPKRPHHIQFMMKKTIPCESWKQYLFLK